MRQCQRLTIWSGCPTHAKTKTGRGDPRLTSFVRGPVRLSRVVEDTSGLTFEEWDPTKDADDSQPPAPMIINSSELRGAGFNLQEVIPPELESAARLGRRTRGAGLRQLEGVGRKRFVLSSDDDNELRSRCE